jgi:hypothetical protein
MRMAPRGLFELDVDLHGVAVQAAQRAVAVLQLGFDSSG